VAIDIVVDFFPKKIQKIFEAVIYVLSVLVIGFFLIHSASFVRQMFQTDRITNILRIPYFLTYSAFPVSCLLMIINYSMVVFRRLKGVGEEDE
jgi:TRAP-type C4-dicarboxylate transport system permease small subunit